MTLLFILSLCSCNPRVSVPHIGIFSTVEPLMRSDSSRTGFFTNASLFDAAYDQIEYRTTTGSVFVPNDGTQNFLLCRYDTQTMQPIWVAVGGGKGGDGGCNYYTVPPENAVYVVGYFEDTAYFPHRAGMPQCDTLISRGNGDAFIAKYDYITGALLWCTSGGSTYPDIVFTDQQGKRHQETIMAVSVSHITVYANFFGPVQFGDHFLNVPLSGSAVQISIRKETGLVDTLRIPTTLPITTQHEK